MPIFDYRCSCGLRFERLIARDAEPPACPECGGPSRKVPSRPAVSGRADPGLSRTEMPQTWRGLYDGDRDYIRSMRRQWAQRQRLEESHPELAGDTRPVVAHEGRYEQAPLRVGDPVLPPPGAPAPKAAEPPAPSHGHGHGPSGASPG